MNKKFMIDALQASLRPAKFVRTCPRITNCKPRACQKHSFRESLCLGVTSLTKEDFDEGWWAGRVPSSYHFTCGRVQGISKKTHLKIWLEYPKGGEGLALWRQTCCLVSILYHSLLMFVDKSPSNSIVLPEGSGWPAAWSRTRLVSAGHIGSAFLEREMHLQDTNFIQFGHVISVFVTNCWVSATFPWRTTVVGTTVWFRRI